MFRGPCGVTRDNNLTGPADKIGWCILPTMQSKDPDGWRLQTEERRRKWAALLERAEDLRQLSNKGILHPADLKQFSAEMQAYSEEMEKHFEEQSEHSARRIKELTEGLGKSEGPQNK